MLARQLAKVALQEDIGPGDITGQSLLSASAPATASIKFKQDGVLAGIQWAQLVLSELDPGAGVELLAQDGDRIREGTVVARARSTQQALVAAERTILNLLQRLCGIATLTARMAELCTGTRAMVLDTRKTTPGLRAFEKYAVRCGGGVNHRMGLYDEAMIKDNHLYISGLDLKEAVARIRRQKPDVYLTAEAESVEQARLAMEAGANVVMLDDFSMDEIRQAVEMRNQEKRFARVQLEISGGVNLSNIEQYAQTGVERISVGALTHSAAALDISMKVDRP
ncbi:carboxylating nicotinate-nucleotide diphosphorylase [bacterium]|nr:MAG: carboxylating nicotinate-nucleotide diphosphorylase [bacterium]RIK63613.1 MAG: carboxylating nicotinate-nucleotide diphosphorylase [Planctomycetota bacterium]